MRFDVAVIWGELGVGVLWTVGHWVTVTVGPLHATVFLCESCGDEPDTGEGGGG